MEASIFQSLYTKLIGELKSKDKFSDVVKAMKMSTEEIIDYCQILPEIENILKSEIDNICVSCKDKNIKDEILAHKLRLEANELYKKTKYFQALQTYNESIIYSLDESSNLALCFSNRSSVAFELGLYQECLDDISWAIEHGHPLRLRPKLITRQAKCLIAQGKSKQAELVLDDFLEQLHDLKLEDSSIKQSKVSLEELKLSCNASSAAGLKVHPDRKFCILPPAEVPIIKDENKHIPSLSSSVDIFFSGDKGRFLVANRDIMPGEVVVCDKSFAAAVTVTSTHTNCSYCMKRAYFLLPCPKCIMVVFCSENCRAAALDSFHRVECEILPVVEKLGMEHGLLQLRVVTKVGMESLRKCISSYEKEVSQNTDRAKLGFNEESMYLSQDYRTIFNLTTNKEHFAENEIFSFVVTAYALLKILEKSNFFPDQNKSDRNLLHKVLFRGMMIIACNPHSINECGLTPSNEEEWDKIGTGLSSVFSLLNHSCDPSTFRFSYCSTIVSGAIKFIPKGGEITDGYGVIFTTHPYEYRRIFFLQHFRFICRCQACLGRWPMLSQLGVDLRLKKSGISQKLYAKMFEKFQVCDPLQDKLDTIREDEINYVKKLMVELCNHSVLPCRYICETGCLLRNIYDRKSSRYLKPSHLLPSNREKNYRKDLPLVNEFFEKKFT